MLPAGIVAVAGSRSLPPGGAALVGRVAADLAESGCSLVVGCCRGADAAVLRSVPVLVPPSRVLCLAAFGPVSPPWPAARYSAPGAWSGSAVPEVARFMLAGGSVSWWAGGPSVPLRSRLAARTRAVVAEASAGLVVFFGSPDSRGSLLAARCAVSRGLPVVAFSVGFPAADLPAIGAGAWIPCNRPGVWSVGFRWAPKNEKIL